MSLSKWFWQSIRREIQQTITSACTPQERWTKVDISMDFIRKPRVKVEKTSTVVNLEQLYPHNVTLYRLPPTEDITLQEFEDLALERLKLLRIFEQAGSRNLRFLSDEWKEHITSEINREGLKGYARLFHNSGSVKESDLQARRRDTISHFILRVAYSRSQDLQRYSYSSAPCRACRKTGL